MTVLASRGSKTQAGIESLYIFDVDIEPLFDLDPTTRQLTSKPDCVEVHLRALPRAGKDGDSLLLESLSGILHCSESRKVQYSIAAEDAGPAHVTISWIVFILFAAIHDVISPTAQMTDDVSQARHKWLEHRVSAFDQVQLASEVSTPGLSEWLRLSQIAAVATMQLKLHDTVRLVVQLGPQSRNDQLHSKSPVLAAVVVAMLRLGTPGLSTDGSNSTAAEWALSAAAERANLRVRGITLSTQNCIQAGSCSQGGLGHINKHNSESSTLRTNSLGPGHGDRDPNFVTYTIVHFARSAMQLTCGSSTLLSTRWSAE